MDVAVGNPSRCINNLTFSGRAFITFVRLTGHSLTLLPMSLTPSLQKFLGLGFSPVGIVIHVTQCYKNKLKNYKLTSAREMKTIIYRTRCVDDIRLGCILIRPILSLMRHASHSSKGEDWYYVYTTNHYIYILKLSLSLSLHFFPSSSSTLHSFVVVPSSTVASLTPQMPTPLSLPSPRLLSPPSPRLLSPLYTLLLRWSGWLVAEVPATGMHTSSGTRAHSNFVIGTVGRKYRQQTHRRQLQYRSRRVVGKWCKVKSRRAVLHHE